ncbi:MAG TPA: DUF2332 domain-containing protein [Actinomycetes bacterium]|nr:DUF2332 domain-containing protein [Actinomycetes bacterium]
MADRERLAQKVAHQGEICARLGSALYGELLARAAEDIRAGGPVARVLAGYEDAPGPAATALRLMGGVHRVVLTGGAPELAAYYPSVGGRADGVAAWPVFRAVVEEHHDEIRRMLVGPPQTNDVGRSAALVGGLLHLTAATGRPVRLFELGTSAGLNLRADHYRITGAGTAWGPADSPVVIDGWQGLAPPTDAPLEVVERVGCDVAPIDVGTEEGRLLLSSYVWADHVDRMTRLRGAFEVAARVPAQIVHSAAVDCMSKLTLQPGALTVLWHSVMWQYVDPDEQRAVLKQINEVAASATEQAPFAHLFLEPRRREPGGPHVFLVTASLWPHWPDERVLASSRAHGVPTTWEL